MIKIKERDDMQHCIHCNDFGYITEVLIERENGWATTFFICDNCLEDLREAINSYQSDKWFRENEW